MAADPTPNPLTERLREHELKTDAPVFEAVRQGLKTWEIRFNDRDFRVGDRLTLRETAFTGKEMQEGRPLVYTGRTLTVAVTYVLTGPIYGLADGWAILSIRAFTAQGAAPSQGEPTREPYAWAVEGRDAGPAREWLPITPQSPPPKDGSEILVWAKSAKGPYVGCFMARWEPGIARWLTDIADGLDGDTLEIENFTHWMPLPAAPSAEKGEAGGSQPQEGS